MINFFDLKKQSRSIKKELLKTIGNVITDAAFSAGPYVEKFEHMFAKFIGTKYAIGLNSGTSALHLAMILLHVGKEDEVIVPANTFIATAWAVSYVGAKPVFADCDPNTWEIDPNDVEKKITAKTKAVIGVHLYGQPFDIDAVKKITKRHKLLLVEDCAQAHGALYKNKKVGSFAEMGCFSFYPSKNLGALGEAGEITTNKKSYMKELKILRNQGSTKKYFHNQIGFNMRMEGIQGAVLSLKLKYLETWNKRRKTIARLYQQQINNPKIKKQFQPKWAESVYHLFVVAVENRPHFLHYLEVKGIGYSIHYPLPCHLQKAFKYLHYHQGDLPIAEKLANQCVSIPIYPEMTNDQIEKVIDVLNKY